MKISRRKFVAMSTASASALTLGSSAVLSDTPPQNSKTKIRTDKRSEPIRRLVAMGESITFGNSAHDPSNEWVQTLAAFIRKFQYAPLQVLNHSIPGNVVSPDAPGYDPKMNPATAPSALERFEKEMIGYQPDLAIYAFGENDSRCGHSLDSFMKAYRKIILTTREKLPNTLMVLVGPFWALQFDAQAWSKQENNTRFGAFGVTGDKLVLSYNKAIAELANEVNAVFVDMYSLLEGAPWLLMNDACHLTDVGQSMIGQQVFIQIASQCSFLSLSSKRAEKELGLGVCNTGGTQAMPYVVSHWRITQ